jgi:small subunit ribosomal protein S13
MPRVVGVDLPDNKKLHIALRYIFGIGPARAMELCKRCNLDPDTRVHKLTEPQVASINNAIQAGFPVEGDLRRQISQDIRRLVSIGCYRGSRHKRGLPVRGQRTRTNARTRKGRRQTVGAIRDKTQRRAVKGDRPAPAAPAAKK